MSQTLMVTSGQPAFSSCKDLSAHAHWVTCTECLSLLFTKPSYHCVSLYTTERENANR